MRLLILEIPTCALLSLVRVETPDCFHMCVALEIQIKRFVPAFIMHAALGTHSSVGPLSHFVLVLIQVSCQVAEVQVLLSVIRRRSEILCQVKVLHVT